MTYHAKRRRPARGSHPNRAMGQDTSPRIAVSLAGDTMMALAKLAASQHIPVASLIRDAVDQYLHRQGVEP